MTAPVPIADTLIAPIMLGVRDCLTAELRRTLWGSVCKTCLVWSEAPYSLDGCDCRCVLDGGEPGVGHAWVRWIDGTPPAAVATGSGSSAARSAVSPCRSGWVLNFEIGTARCVQLSEDGTESPCDQLTQDSLHALSDAAALRRVLCCGALRDKFVTVVRAAPRGRGGGCVGTVLQFAVRTTGNP